MRSQTLTWTSSWCAPTWRPAPLCAAPGFLNSVMIIEQVCPRHTPSLPDFLRLHLLRAAALQAGTCSSEGGACTCTQVMAHVASHLGADPTTVRQRNFLKTYPFPTPALVEAPADACTAPSNGSVKHQAGDRAGRAERPWRLWAPEWLECCV